MIHFFFFFFKILYSSFFQIHHHNPSFSDVLIENSFPDNQMIQSFFHVVVCPIPNFFREQTIWSLPHRVVFLFRIRGGLQRGRGNCG
ncbi:hypothetical protein M758_UG237900 [Ceratodon purpureus]|nr:hypothetical protein M758_UG237900 [Ceratodon purpureus]